MDCNHWFIKPVGKSSPEKGRERERERERTKKIEREREREKERKRERESVFGEEDSKMLN